MPMHNQWAEKAVAEALRTRRKAGYKPEDPLCVYDLAEGLGIDVRFAPILSLEGVLYHSNPPTVILSSLRPAGRRCFTCAHEIGHWRLGHGSTIDELAENRKYYSTQERLADSFAGILLMPREAVQHALEVRGLVASQLTPPQAFLLSGLFGVGYTALVNHLSRGLALISEVSAKRLIKVPLSRIRSEILKNSVGSPLHVVDHLWKHVIDVEVGDLIHFRGTASITGQRVAAVSRAPDATVFEAKSPGIDQLVWTDGAAFVRVSRREFQGRSVFRHLDEDENE